MCLAAVEKRMKTMSLSDAKNRFSEVVALSQGEKILVLKHGKPVALIQGVEGYELGELLTYADLEFWQWAARRQQQALASDNLVAAEEVRRELLPDASPVARPRKRSRRKKR